MEKLMEILTKKEILIAAAVLIVLLIVFICLRSSRKKKYLAMMAEQEVRYNSIKSIPLSFKLNKAVAIARLDEKTIQNVAQYKDDFEQCQSNLKQISSMLADTEDLIQLGKLKLAKLNLIDVDNLLSLAESQVGTLNGFLDTILEKESAQRAEVTQLKDEFRTIKKTLKEKSAQLSFCWDMIETKISACEKRFTAFEEWMYASEFDKASVELKGIRECLDEFVLIYKEIPNLLQQARGIVPNMIDEVSGNYAMECKKGVYLQHLEVPRNIEIIQETLKEDLNNLKKGNIENIKVHCDDYLQRLTQLNQQMKKESSSYDEVIQAQKKVQQGLDACLNLQNYVESLSEEDLKRFGILEIKKNLDSSRSRIESLSSLKEKINGMINENSVPASTILLSLKELLQDEESLVNEYSALKSKIENARSDEERAHKQLLKLDLIMNEMQVKIRKNRLPNISNSFEEDLRKARAYVESIKGLLLESPLNVVLLNSTLNEAIDYIYKLYNDVNNVVGMAIMAENTIVFGNKYRSSYPDIDSELTRAELCYRNGEYTQALKIAIATIEKIFPENYEQLIKENAQSAA